MGRMNVFVGRNAFVSGCLRQPLAMRLRLEDSHLSRRRRAFRRPPRQREAQPLSVRRRLKNED